MDIVQDLNYKLNSVPWLKRMLKRGYQRLNCAIGRTVLCEGDIRKVSPMNDGYEYFFGYYDKSPWDATGRYMLCLKAKDTSKYVSPKEPAEIILIDTEKEPEDPCRYVSVSSTRTWNVQQGCMLQWLGPDHDKEIIFNDYRDGKYVSVILNIFDKSERIVERPVYTVSSDGTTALSLDFSRLYNLRPGYGYYNVPEKTKGVGLPDSCAVWRVDLLTGRSEEILKYTDFAHYLPRQEMLKKDSVHKVNHLMLSPDGDRFMVIYRWFNGQKKYSRLLTCSVDGSDMCLLLDEEMVSHCCWKDDEHILAFAVHEGKRGYYLIKDRTKEVVRTLEELTTDGHPGYSPDGEKIVTDTYADRSRMCSVFVASKGKVSRIARVFEPFTYDNDTRCDLHPRWKRDGSEICFDSVYEGKRGMYVIKCGVE